MIGNVLIETASTLDNRRLLLLFIVVTAVILIDYEFGLVSIGFTGLSTYLICVGLYSSAVTLSQDLTLRKTIRKSVLERSKLLDSIATAQMEKELQTCVFTIAQKTSHEMKENSRIEPHLRKMNLRDYMSIVMNELKIGGK